MFIGLVFNSLASATLLVADCFLAQCSFDQMEKHVKSSKEEHLQLALDEIKELRAKSDETLKTLQETIAAHQTTVAALSSRINKLEQPKATCERFSVMVPVQDEWMKSKINSTVQSVVPFSFENHQFQLMAQCQPGKQSLGMYLSYEGPAPGLKARFQFSTTAEDSEWDDTANP